MSEDRTRHRRPAEPGPDFPASRTLVPYARWLFGGILLGGFGLSLAGCGFLPSASPPTTTPYPFVTASPELIPTPLPATATLPPSPTPSLPPPTPTLQDGQITPTIGPQGSPTPAPSPTIAGVEIDCPVPPQGGFGVIFESDPGLRPAIGCPTSRNPDEPPQAWILDTGWQPFERGQMLWSAGIGWKLQPVVYVLYEDGTYQLFEDTYDEGVDPFEGELAPPPGLYQPQGSLGKVWRDGIGVSERLGWATAPEGRDLTQMQVFTNGEMVYVRQVGLTYVFKHATPNTWLTYEVNF
jgi:hypothetical protein